MLLVQPCKVYIFASGNAGNLTLSLASGDFATGATITVGASTIDVKQSSDTASNIQIFTREGRHIAGSPLIKIRKIYIYVYS